MRGRAIFLCLLVGLLASVAVAQSKTVSSSSDRKILSKVQPVYPELARKMHIRGNVRVEIIVRPNGSVKETRVLGGNPVLVEATKDAISKWKFEPASGETTEVVQLSFEGQ